MSAWANRLYRLERSQRIDAPLPSVFDFFADAANLGELTPGFLGFRIRTPLPIAMSAGTRIDYTITLTGVPMRWRTHITAWEPGVRFVDEQERGPYALWNHAHEFEADGPSTIMRDVVDYALPFGPIGALVHGLFVGRILRRIFDYRRDAIARLLETRSRPRKNDATTGEAHADR